MLYLLVELQHEDHIPPVDQSEDVRHTIQVQYSIPVYTEIEMGEDARGFGVKQNARQGIDDIYPCNDEKYDSRPIPLLKEDIEEHQTKKKENAIAEDREE